MKTTTIFRKLLLLSALFVAFASASSLKAQSCTYVIENNITCPIPVQVTWTDCFNVICGTPVSVPVGAGVSQPLLCPCSGTTSICNITVVLTDINGTAISGMAVDNINPTNGATTTACGGISYNMNWSNGITVIF